MSNVQGPPNDLSRRATPFVPLACLFAAIVLLSSVTPVIKYVFQHSSFQPIELASFRVIIGFVGFLGVFSYAISAWGLMNTSVVHYALIYSLLPSCTAALSVLCGKDHLSAPKCVGILCSLVGCIIAISQVAPYEEATIQFGDVFVLLFTVMMSAHIVCSSGVVKRFGVMVSNTVMFGSSSLLLFLGSLEWSEPLHGDVSPIITASVLYVG